MIGYYSAIIFLIVFSMGIMISIAYYDEILPPRSKKGFLLTFSLVIVVSLTEWITRYLENSGPNFRGLNIFASYIYLVITPAIPVLLAYSITNFKRRKIATTLLVYNVIIQTMNLFLGFMFTIDANNRYFRGDFYLIDLPVSVYCVCVLFARTYKVAKKYQTKNTYILFGISVLLAGGTTLQMTQGRVLVLWLTSAISAMLVYTYYTAVVNEVDALTDLLNRSCYENKLAKVKDNGAVLFFDVNRFKEVNDNYGHNFGDVCLVEVAKTISEVYRPFGLCYRVGGDEFSVLLKDSNVNIVELNENFKQKIEDKKREDDRMPTVSVGYSIISEEIDVFTAVSEADKMMYACKNKEHNKE